MVLELIVFGKWSFYLAQNVQDGLPTVLAELPENKGAFFNMDKGTLCTLGESVIAVFSWLYS